MGVLSPDLDSSGSHVLVSTLNLPPSATLVFVFAVVFICSCLFWSQCICICICICVLAVDDVVCHMSQPRLWLDSGLPGNLLICLSSNLKLQLISQNNLWQTLLTKTLNSYLLYKLRHMYIIINSILLICLSSNLKLQLISQTVQLLTDSSLCDFKFLSAFPT